MKTFISLIMCLAALLFFQCAAHTNLEPVGNGNLAVDASIGGPIVKAFGTKIPVPYLTTGVNYGLKDNLDFTGNLHILSLPYQIFGMEPGITWYPVLQKGKIPTIGINPHALILMSLKSDVGERIKCYPVLSGSAAWQMKNGLFYTGMDLTYRLSDLDYNKDESPAIVSPFFGYQWKLGARTRMNTELKWHAANLQTDQLAVEYLGIGSHGAISTLFSIQRSF